MEADLSVWGIHDCCSPEDLRPTGCGFYRIVLPLEQLKAAGWRVRWQALTPPPEADGYRVMVGERLDQPDVLGDWRRMRLRHRTVYEIDDDVYNVDAMNRNAYKIYGDPAYQDAVSHCAAVSDVVTVTTEPLAEVMRQHNPNVRVIANFVPEETLAWQRPRRAGKLVLGWAGGGSHTWDVAMIAETVRLFLERHPRAELNLVGCDFRRTFCMNQTRFTQWEPDQRLYYRNIDFDIGLAPLTGSVFDASKSCIKALEYAALGIPVIASDVEAYRGFVIDGVTGFLCRTQKQWRAALRELAHDPALRESMGAKAREQARDWTIEGNYWRWAQVYSEIQN
jgi:glycosyltransferase involved in cell wall biosynthesis